MSKSAADIYVFKVDPDSDTAAANVLRLVGNGKDVLELGAGPGSISRALVQFNDCRVVAAEMDPNCLPILEKFCTRVVQADLNRDDWVSHFSESKFDVIVIADVLEHLVDPWKVLRDAARLLRPGGRIVSSIPNASHAALVANFLTDDVQYRDWGLLDRTHIRFFGAKNLQHLFRQATLKIIDARYVVRPAEVTEFAETWRQLPSQTRNVLDGTPFSQVYQTVVAAIPADTSQDAEFDLLSNAPPKASLSIAQNVVAALPHGQTLKTRIGRMLGPKGRAIVKQILGMN